MSSFSDLIGKTITDIVIAPNKERVKISTDDGKSYAMWHSQGCCENVELIDVAGDLSDVIGSPILSANEVSNSDEGERPERADDSWTWTFYTLATIKGSVTLRWLGTSNGYYGESVDFSETKA